MENEILPVESIQERDVDLILLEELYTDDNFCKWFIQELSLPEISKIEGTWRSITDFGLGETDILFSYFSNEKKVYVLIENKIDASFQDNQFKRYEIRGKKYIQKKACDIAYSILVAPNLYCKNQNDFEYFISYETIAERLIFTGSKRNLFKSKLLQIASEKLRRGYQPINSIPVQNFWHAYWKFIQKKYPSFNMKKPGIVPQNSDWPMLFDDRLKGITFYHKLAHGNTDANFRGFSKNLKDEIKAILPEKAIIIEHNKSFSVRIISPKIDRMQDFNKQIKDVKEGLGNLELLRKWVTKNQII